MAIGPRIRKLIGPFEKPVSEIYRSIFVDLKVLRHQIEEWIPPADGSQILEVGCGEGAIIELLADIFPTAQITGIDITPQIGRLFKGDLSRVSFRKQTIKDFSSENYGRFDLVVINDVLHHIPPKIHKEFLNDTKKSLKKGGLFLFKDWKRSKTPIHLFSFLMERYITGDKVCYLSSDELRGLLIDVFGAKCIKDEASIPPWDNNIAFLVQNKRDV